MPSPLDGPREHELERPALEFARDRPDCGADAITHEAASRSGCAVPRPTQIASQLPPKMRSAMRI